MQKDKRGGEASNLETCLSSSTASSEVAGALVAAAVTPLRLEIASAGWLSTCPSLNAFFVFIFAG